MHLETSERANARLHEWMSQPANRIKNPKTHEK
jgi:hypothetical protein